MCVCMRVCECERQRNTGREIMCVCDESVSLFLFLGIREIMSLCACAFVYACVSARMWVVCVSLCLSLCVCSSV